MINHDAAPGPLQHCQITGSSDLNLVIDLGHQSPCDAVLSADQLDQPEHTYPLRLMHCPESGLAQLDYVVDGREIYPPSYPYRSGISKPLEQYQRVFADAVMNRWQRIGPLVVDIGSNDGTLLTGFKRHGARVLGVEPTDIAKIARSENGIETLQEFFGEWLAGHIVADYGRAKFITMTNVFAHMAGLGEVMRGISRLLDDDGIFITESHYLLDVLQRNQFDTIYHEHIRTYSLKSLVKLADQYGMEVFDVQRADRYGGNIRAYIARKGAHPIEAAVQRLLDLEQASGLHEPQSWVAFRDRVLANRDVTMEFLYKTRRSGASIAGKSCPGRCASLLNFYGVTKDLIPYLAELSTSLKLGKFLPGKHIPIVDERRLFEEKPDVVLLFAWHYGEFIAKRLRADGLCSRLFAPLPQFGEVP